MMSQTPLTHTFLLAGLIIYWSSMPAFLQAQGDAPCPQATQASWIQGPIHLKGLSSIRDIRSSVSGDFDGNGMEDILISTPAGLHIAFNEARGLQPFKTFATKGQVVHTWWDESDQRLWTQEDYPSQVSTWAFQGGKFVKVESFAESPTRARLVPGEGLICLTPFPSQLKILQPDGRTEMLLPDAEGILDGDIITLPEGKNALILQDARTGALGISTQENNQWNKVKWWPESTATSNWQTYTASNGQPHLFYELPSNLWHTTFDEKGNWQSNWCPGVTFRDFQWWIKPHPDPEILDLVTRRKVTFNLTHYRMSMSSGALSETQVLSEFSDVPFIVTPDLDGDGERDILHPSPAEDGAWHWYALWRNGPKRLLWTQPNVSSTDYLPLQQVWLDALEEMTNITEVWAYKGELLVRHNDNWSRVYALSPSSEIRNSPDTERTSEKIITQLTVPYLDLNLNPNGVVPQGIARLQPGKWHHVVFSRDRNQNTQVWLDAKCVFRGKSVDYRYRYNAIAFGTSFSRDYSDFGDIDLDRVTLSGKTWTEKDVADEFAFARSANALDVGERWDFESLPIAGTLKGEPAAQLSAPTLTKGIDGLALSFDGKDDGLRCFLAIPHDELTVSCFVRIHPESPNTSHTLFQLYGMYNASIRAVEAPESTLARSEIEGSPIGSPAVVGEEPLNIPKGSQAFAKRQTLFFLSPDGQMFEAGALGWAPKASPPLPNPVAPMQIWVEDEIHVINGQNEHWQWNQGSWSQCETWAHAPLVSSIACRGGAFFQTKDRWFWKPHGSNELFSPEDSVPAPFWVASMLGHDDVSFEANAWTTWRNGDGFAFQPQTEEAFQLWPSWIRWMGGLGISLAAVLGFVFWRRRAREQQIQPMDIPSILEKLPRSVSQGLKSLLESKNASFDTVLLDDILGSGEYGSDDTRRARRSRFIRDCNESGTAALGCPILERIQDPTDRRRTVYRFTERFRALMGRDASSS